MRKKSARWHTVYSIISTIIEEAGIAAGLLWLLPLFGIFLPAWGVIAIMAGFAVYSYIMYRIGHPTITYKEISSPESIIGCIGVAETRLQPVGMVKVNGELWQAVCINEGTQKGDQVVVTGIEGLKLTVKKSG